MGTLLAIKRIHQKKGYPIDRYKCLGCGQDIEKEPEEGIIIIVNLLS